MTAGAIAAPNVETARFEPQRRRRPEAADFVIGGSIALVALIVGIFVLLCFQGFDSTIATTRTRAQTAADIVTDETRWVVSSARALLDSVAAAVTTDPATIDPAAIAAISAGAARLPDSVGLAIYDAGGAELGNLSSGDGPPDIADRDYFAAVAGGEDWALSRQEAARDGSEPTFVVARRLEANGAFAGVATVMIRAEVLVRFAAAQNLGPESTISIVRSDGWVIARSPALATPLDLSGTPAFARLTSAAAGTYDSASSPADGVARMVAFRHVDDLGYIAIASVSLDAAIGGLWYAIIIVSLLLAPIAVTVLAGSFVTARLLRRSQATTRSLGAALEQNSILFREIHHRVKNNLESVNALLRLQKIAPAAREELGRRLYAMSSVHEHIYRSSNFAEVRARNYLLDLIANIRASYDPNIQVIEDLDDISVHTDAATPLGLLVNEVVSNSFKHAFPNGRAGIIRVSLKAEGPDRARLTVSDDGVGLDPAAPTTGIGRRLVGGFVQQLQGESRHSGDNGSEFTVSFPLTRG
jgi:two-component sensor histidine kinase